MDEEEQRRARILNIILLGSIAMLVVLDTIVLYYSLREGSADQQISFGAFSILPAFFVFLYILSLRGHSKIASYLAVGAYLASNGYSSYRWGVTMHVGLIAYALIIIAATIMRGTRFGFLVTGIIGAYIVPIGYAQFSGLIPTQPQKMRAADVLVFATLYLLIMIVAWLYSREIDRSMEHAHRFENALEQERDMLEIKVAERTAELRNAQLEKMRQMNRFAELGQLSSGLFHDLLNLLNALSLRSETETDPSLRNAFDTARQIENFTHAVRKQLSCAEGKDRFSLTQGVEHAIQLVNYKASRNGVCIAFPADREDISHTGTPFKFHEILINLLMNAIESYEPGGQGTTRTVDVSLEKDASHATLRVRDRGCGMTPEVKKRIFEPFFTTKDHAHGIGIGLATVKKITEEDLHGTISVESEPGKGSLFIVRFPLEKSPQSSMAPDNEMR